MNDKDYFEDYEHCNSKMEHYWSQRKRQLQKLEAFWNTPDNIVKKYFPNPVLVKANKNNIWYVGALEEKS